MSYIRSMPRIKFSPGAKPGVFTQGGKPVLYEFHSKENYDNWYKSTLAGLAEFDQYMNFCEYFVREKGDKGHYVRDGKSFPVDGSWVGIQDLDDVAKHFSDWLEEQGWRKDWYRLMPRYVKQLGIHYKEPTRVTKQVV